MTYSEVEVDFEAGFPARLRWSSRAWDVIDTPTRLGVSEDRAYSELITHPPRPWLGWRFTARADDGEVLLFDVKAGIDDCWELIRVYRWE